jgi:hypothetical protein
VGEDDHAAGVEKHGPAADPRQRCAGRRSGDACHASIRSRTLMRPQL